MQLKSLNLRLTILSTIVFLVSFSTSAQIEPNDAKFDYKSATISFDGLIRKIEKPEKLYANANNTFKYNYPVEIDNARGGYTYRGKIYCNFVNQQSEAQVSIVSTFGGLQSATGTKDETVDVQIPGTGNTTKAYIRNYKLVYPVTMKFYEKGNLVRTVDFFTESSPLYFRFTKDLTEISSTSYNTPFASVKEISDYEASNKMNKAAEKFAYFEAVRKIDEIIKTFYGSFEYDFEIGSLSIRKKKSAAYADINEASALLDAGISAYKKKNLVVRDSLVRLALGKLTSIAALTEDRLNPTAREVILYNTLVCHALLGETSKAQEELAKYVSGGVQRQESFSGNSISRFIGVSLFRSKIAQDSEIHL